MNSKLGKQIGIQKNGNLFQVKVKMKYKNIEIILSFFHNLYLK